jgi:hypothetical protein
MFLTAVSPIFKCSYLEREQELKPWGENERKKLKISASVYDKRSSRRLKSYLGQVKISTPRGQIRAITVGYNYLTANSSINRK